LAGDFNNLRRWEYHLIGQLINGGTGYLVETEEGLEDSVNKALDSNDLSVINVCVDRTDVSDCLRRMTEALGKRV
jgi:TPP-dependent 2-oxoacid decarboxylase